MFLKGYFAYRGKSYNLIKCKFHLIYDDRLSYGYIEICVTTTEFVFLCADFGWRTFFIYF